MDCKYIFRIDIFTKRSSVWCQIDRKSVITIQIWFDSTGLLHTWSPETNAPITNLKKNSFQNLFNEDKLIYLQYLTQ